MSPPDERSNGPREYTMCPPVGADDKELSRAAARVRAVGKYAPGTRVRVRERVIDDGTREFTIDKVALWQQPFPEAADMTHRWKDNRRDHEYKRRLVEMRGPNLFKGQRATVIACLPSVECTRIGSRPWIMLLSDSGLIGWLYAFDGLELLSPAGETLGGSK